MVSAVASWSFDPNILVYTVMNNRKGNMKNTINEKDLVEIRNRDFLQIVDYFPRHKDIESELVYGKFFETSPIVTILMPIYNHPLSCIESAISSAVNQNTNYNYQILVVDDYADESNNTISVIEKINSPKVIYFRNKENIGLFGNWNRCVWLARTKWITFLHSDDILASNFVETMCNTIEKYGFIDQLACKSINYDIDNYNIESLEKKITNEKGEIRKVLFEDYIDRMATSIKGAFIKREHLISIGGFADMDDGLGLSDYLTMLKYCHYYNIYYLDKLLYFNGWGVNDTLNVSHWYPEIVSNYYMQMFFYNKMKCPVKQLYGIRCAHRAYRTAKWYNSGDNFLGKVIPVDIDQLRKDCCIKRKPNLMYTIIGFTMSFIKKLYIKRKTEIIQRA